MPDLISMRFLKDAPPYAASEVAGFSSDKALALYRNRTAEPVNADDLPSLDGGGSSDAGSDAQDAASETMQLIAENAVLRNEVESFRTQLAQATTMPGASDTALGGDASASGSAGSISGADTTDGAGGPGDSIDGAAAHSIDGGSDTTAGADTPGDSDNVSGSRPSGTARARRT